MSAFPAPFAFPFAPDLVIPVPDPITQVLVTPIIPDTGADHNTQALSRLSQQFKDAGG